MEITNRTPLDQKDGMFPAFARGAAASFYPFETLISYTETEVDEAGKRVLTEGIVAFFYPAKGGDLRNGFDSRMPYFQGVIDGESGLFFARAYDPATAFLAMNTPGIAGVITPYETGQPQPKAGLPQSFLI